MKQPELKTRLLRLYEEMKSVFQIIDQAQENMELKMAVRLVELEEMNKNMIRLLEEIREDYNENSNNPRLWINLGNIAKISELIVTAEEKHQLIMDRAKEKTRIQALPNMS